MPKTITIMLLSGYQENEDAMFTVRFSEAALKAGHKVNIFLFGNACNMANEEKPIEGRLKVSEQLKIQMDIGKLGPEFTKIAEMGADIVTCHTTEYGRGTEADTYRQGVKWGDVGGSYTGFLTKSDVHLSIAH